MDNYTASETAWRNGFERGYVRGVLDKTAEAMSGSIEWHEGIPKEDHEYCYICEPAGYRKYIIRPARYERKRRSYLIEDFDEEGGYCPRRLGADQIRFWAHVKDPFTMRISFTVPEDKS